VLQKAAEKTTEVVRSSSAVASAGLETFIAQSGMQQFRSLDSIPIPPVKSVNSSGRPSLGSTANLPQLPFFAHSSVATNVRAPGLLPSTYSLSDSVAVAAAAQKLSLQSKGKLAALTVSLVQQEPRPGSLSSAAMPAIQHHLVPGSQTAAFGLINSQLRKVAGSSLAAVLVAPPVTSATTSKSLPAAIPPRGTYSLSTAGVSLPPAVSANVGLSIASTAGVMFTSSVPPFSSVSKPVMARLMAQQRLPGVLALSGMPP